MACWQRLNNKTLLYPVSQFSPPLSHSETGIPQPGSAQPQLQQVQLLAAAPPGVWGQLAFGAGRGLVQAFHMDSTQVHPSALSKWKCFPQQGAGDRNATGATSPSEVMSLIQAGPSPPWGLWILVTESHM